MGKQLGELQEHLGTREEISISRVAIFPLRLTWDHTYCIHLHSFIRSLKRHRCEQESLSVSVQSRKSGGEVSSMQQRVSGTRTSFGRRQDKAECNSGWLP